MDFFDALANDRPYRRAWERERIVEEIRTQSGQHFDPRVVEAFLQLLETPLVDQTMLKQRSVR